MSQGEAVPAGALEFHEAAIHFPMHSGEQFAGLVESIRRHGWDGGHPIILCEGKILDGRNRYKACVQLGVEPSFVEFVGDPFGKAWLANGERRDIEPGQRAIIWLALKTASDEWQQRQSDREGAANAKRSAAAKEQARMPRDDGSTAFGPGAVSRETAPGDSNRARTELAQHASVSEATAGRVLTLAAKRPDLLAKVAVGEIKLTEALRQAKRDALSETVPLPSSKFRVIYVDPPWEYGNAGLQQYGHAAHHYPTMSIPDLCALGVEDIAEENAVLFLWVTSPLLEDAFRVIAAWGFTYKSSFIWDKVSHNFGHYNSVRHECLLICTRGSCTPDAATLIDSVVQIKRTKTHSEKPEQFRRIIDTLYPQGRRVELFARKPVQGWETWGNEAARARPSA